MLKPAQIIVLLQLALPFAAAAQITDQRLPVSMNAVTMQLDAKSSMMVFTGLSLTQGNIGIEADAGRASKLDFEDSVWHVSGNVRIDTGSGHVECDTADLHFSGHQLQSATVVGKPATFELRRDDSEQTTYAEAGRLEYDVTAGVVEFSDNATITEGGNKISSNYLLYNIREQRINAQSAGDGGERVRITYTPGDEQSGSSPDDNTPDDPNEDDGGGAR